jgi:hypothetical protein
MPIATFDLRAEPEHGIGYATAERFRVQACLPERVWGAGVPAGWGCWVWGFTV